MDKHKEELAKILVEKSYKEGDFTLSSGKKSSYYFDCKQTALHPNGAYLLSELFLEAIMQYPEIKGVGGMTLGADPLVCSVVALSFVKGSPLPGFIVRKKPKGHGTDAYLEGLANFCTGDRIIMLEDVVTTGGTLLTACKRVQDAGLVVAGVICVLDREEGGRENLAKAGYGLKAIYTRSALKQDAGI